MKLKSATALVASSLTLFVASLAIAQSHPAGTPQHGPVTAVPVTRPGGGTAHAGLPPGTGPTAATPIVAPPGVGASGTGTAGSTGTGFAGPGHQPPTTLTQAGGGASVHEFEAGIDYTPLPPGARITFNLQDADLPDLIRAIGNITGKRFILPGKVRSIKTTIYSPTKVTPGEAYQAFLSTLEANGLTVVPSGRYLKITETGGIATDSLPTYAPGEGSPANDEYVTRIHRLHNIAADDAAGVLGHFKSHDGDITPYAATNTLVITDTGSNIRRMLQILAEVDVPSVGEQIWIERLHYASAQDMSQRITDILGGGSGGSGGGGGGGAGHGAATAASTSDTRLTRIMPDERSNSLIIVATERMYLRVLELIRRLDVPIQNGEGDIQVYYLQHADAEELSNTLNQITGGGTHGAAGAPAPQGAGGAGQHALSIFEGPVRISPDKRTNSLIITSSPRDFAGIRRVINELDHARRQVFIEAVVMELSVNNTSKLGVSWHGPLPDPTGGGGFGLFGFGALNSVGFPTSLATNQDALQGLALGVRGPYINGTQNLIPGLTLGVPAFGAVIDALAQSGDSDVLATPSVIALDNEPADINIGQDIPLQQNVGGIPSLGGAGGAAGGLGGLGGLGLGLGGFSAPRTKVGTKIHIVPHINESNEIRMEIEEEVSEAGAPVGALGVVPINLRTAKTKMVVQDQQTVVIGGLVRNSIQRGTTRIPILGDLPLIGALFRTESRTVDRRNLLLFLTPYVIRDQSDLRRIFERKMRERQEFMDHYFVFSESEGYHPHVDYSRTNGLVEEIRQAVRDLREQAEVEARAMPPPMPPHTATEPIELPAEARPAASAGTAGAGPPGGEDNSGPEVSVPRVGGATVRPSMLTTPRPAMAPPPPAP